MKLAHLLTPSALLLAALACGNPGPAQAPPPKAVPVRLAPSLAGDVQDWVAVTLEATRRATVATRLAASVRKVHVLEGQRVAAGELLVSLSDEDLQEGLRAAGAAVAASETQMTRMENLSKQDAAIPAEVDMARVQLAQARAGLAAVRANLAYTRIRAPFAGVVQTRRVNEGDFVGPGMPLLEMEDASGLEFTGSLSGSEARDLKVGRDLPFVCDGRTGLARITGLATGEDPVSHRGSLRARVVKGGEGLRSGAFGRLRLPSGPGEPGRVVPRSAVIRRGELSGVFVAREGRAELRWLSLGEPQGDRVPVRAGLSGDEPVIDNPAGLRDGQAIEVTK
jgi:RND family efflux transporter MFP subunit